MWSCSCTNTGQPLTPAGLAEQKLAIQRGPRGRKVHPLVADEGAILRLATFMRQLLNGNSNGSSSSNSNSCRSVQIATDGGASTHQPAKTFNRYAGWAAAVFACDANQSSFDSFDGTADLSEQELKCFKTVGGRVPGLDSSAYAAELWAAIIAISAASRLHEQGITLKLDIFIDNAAVCKLVKQIGLGVTRRPCNYRLQAAWIMQESEGMQVCAHWVPSHGNNATWTAPVDTPATTGQVRALNAAADGPAAQNASSQLRASKACDASNLRQQKALERVFSGSSSYKEKVFR